MNEPSTPAQIFQRSAARYLSQKELIQQIVDAAQKDDRGGYLIPESLYHELIKLAA